MAALGWREIRDMAAQAGAAHPDLVAAQWALESGWGASPSGRNNFFGLKAAPGESGSTMRTQEHLGGKNVTIPDSFMNFESPQDSVNTLVNRWYKDYKGYKGVNRAQTAVEAADQLKAQGYATDPSYSAKLKDLVAKHGGGKGVPPPVAGAPRSDGTPAPAAAPGPAAGDEALAKMLTSMQEQTAALVASMKPQPIQAMAGFPSNSPGGPENWMGPAPLSIPQAAIPQAFQPAQAANPLSTAVSAFTGQDAPAPAQEAMTPVAPAAPPVVDQVGKARARRAQATQQFLERDQGVDSSFGRLLKRRFAGDGLMDFLSGPLAA
jgi:hypothetical protein